MGQGDAKRLKRAILPPSVMLKFMKKGARRRVLALGCACLGMILAQPKARKIGRAHV